MRLGSSNCKNRQVTLTGSLKPAAGIVEVKTPAGGLVKKVSAKEGKSEKRGFATTV